MIGFTEESLNKVRKFNRKSAILSSIEVGRNPRKQTIKEYYTGNNEKDNPCLLALNFLEETIGEENIDNNSYITFLKSIALSEPTEQERKIIERVEKRRIIEVKVSVKLFGFEYKPLYKALHDTVKPFIPDLTGNENQCISFLKNIGITNVGVRGSQIPEEQLTSLVKTLYSRLKRSSRRERKPGEILGEVYYLSNTKILADIRERATAISYLMDLKGPEYVVTHQTSRYYLNLLSEIFDSLPQILSSTYRNIRRVKCLDYDVLIARSSEDNIPLDLLYEVLIDLDLISKNKCILLEHLQEYYKIPHHILKRILAKYDVFLSCNKTLKEITLDIDYYSIHIEGDNNLLRLIKEIKIWSERH